MLLSTSSWAQVCQHGVIEFGRNGKCYCRSTVSSNDSNAHYFYAALVWCDAQGLTRTTVQSACDYDSNEKWNTNNWGVCPNFKNWQNLRDANEQPLADGKRFLSTLTPNNSGNPMGLVLWSSRTHGELWAVNINRNNGYNERAFAYCDVPQSICDELAENIE